MSQENRTFATEEEFLENVSYFSYTVETLDEFRHLNLEDAGFDEESFDEIEITMSYRKESENEWSEHIEFSRIGSNVADGSETGNTLNNQDVYELFCKISNPAYTGGSISEVVDNDGWIDAEYIKPVHLTEEEKAIIEYEEMLKDVINKVTNLYRNGDLAKISITDKEGRQVSYRYAGAGFFLETTWESNSGDYTYCRYCNSFGHADNIKHAEYQKIEDILASLKCCKDEYIEIYELKLA